MRHGKIRYLVLVGNAESPERDTQVCIPKLCQPTQRNISSTTVAMTTCVNCGSQSKERKAAKEAYVQNWIV